MPESSGSAVPITFTQLVVGSSRKLLSDQLGPKSCMAQRIFHIDKSHVAKVTFTARDGAGRRPLTSWRRIYRVIFLTGPPLKMSLDWPPLNLLELAPPHNFF